MDMAWIAYLIVLQNISHFNHISVQFSADHIFFASFNISFEEDLHINQLVSKSTLTFRLNFKGTIYALTRKCISVHKHGSQWIYIRGKKMHINKYRRYESNIATSLFPIMQFIRICLKIIQVLLNSVVSPILVLKNMF